MKAFLLVGVAWLSISFAHPQDISDVFPILKSLPAPATIQEGVRLSYYGSIGDIPGEEFDKWGGEEGNWDYATAPSGHGYTQVDVVAVSGGVAALTVQAWQYSNWTGPLVPIRGGQSGLVCAAGGGDWWIHPQALAQIQEVQEPDLIVVRLTQILDGKSYPAIRLQRVTAESRVATVYDLETGLLLFKSTAVQTDRSTFASQMFYQGSRQLPSVRRISIPLWLKPGMTLGYEGEYIAQVFGNSPTRFPLAVDVEVLAVGEGWFLYEQTTTLGSLAGLPPTVEKATLLGGGGNLYSDPATLRSFTPGQVLDTDPITGARLSVVEAGLSVTIRSMVGSVSATEFDFDLASGLMSGVRSWDSTDPLYQLGSELRLTDWPDLNQVAPPKLAVVKRGRSVVLSCPDRGVRAFSVEACVDGGPWEAVGKLTGPGEWEAPLDRSRTCVLYRLRP